MLCRAVVNGALRKLGRLGGGREPRLADSEDTLAALRGLYPAWAHGGAFGVICTVRAGPGTHYAAPNTRVIGPEDVDFEVVLPRTGSSAEGLAYRPYAPGPAVYGDPVLDMTYFSQPSGRPDWGACPALRTGSCVEVLTAEGTETLFLYCVGTATWQVASRLTLDSPAPLAYADPTGLQACLAVEMADQFGAELHPATVAQAARYAKALTGRYAQPRAAAQGEWY